MLGKVYHIFIIMYRFIEKYCLGFLFWLIIDEALNWTQRIENNNDNWNTGSLLKPNLSRKLCISKKLTYLLFHHYKKSMWCLGECEEPAKGCKSQVMLLLQCSSVSFLCQASRMGYVVKRVSTAQNTSKNFIWDIKEKFSGLNYDSKSA